MKLNRYFLWLAFVLPFFAAAQQVPPRPSPEHLVNNLSTQEPDFLSANEQAALEQKLQAFSNQTSNQIVIVIVDDFGGMDANMFATEIGNQWGAGQKKFDNGVVIVVKPTGPSNQRDVYIAVGRGLEGAIPDITAKHIVDNEIIPEFKSGNYYAGLNAGTDVLMKLAKGEYNAATYEKQHQPHFNYAWIIIALIFGFWFLRLFTRRGRGYTIGRGGYYGGFGGGGWGGGGFGGGGGGGFGGFGGGSFGGGGAGGKW